MTVETLFVLAATFAAATAATGGLRILLLNNAYLDVPNERSSHTVPTPRGGGIAVVALCIIVLWLTAYLPDVILLCCLLLAAVSWFDDMRSLPVLPRIAAQFAAVAAAIVLAPPSAVALTFSPQMVFAALVIGIIWVWYINLYNFMDGVDGITGVETISICAGTALIAALTPGNDHLIAPAMIIAAATAGFLCWNWHPAKIFLGDVGSIPLGFITGYLLWELAAAGQPAAALLIPGYYLADATITLIRRAARGEKVWLPHKEHFYQRAHQRGLSHSAISLQVAAVNVILIGSALIAALGQPILGLLIGAGVIVIFLLHLQGRRETNIIK